MDTQATKRRSDEATKGRHEGTEARRHVVSLVAALGLMALLFAGLAGCNTKHEVVVSQPKPLEVNVNLTGRLELIVTDARQDLSDITGQAPRQKVSLEDIGLPASAFAPSSTAPAGPASLRMQATDLAYMMADEAPREVELKKAMAGRYSEVRKLLSAKAAGEAHTGLVAARDTLTPAQTALMAAENKDRAELYALVAQRTKTPADQVALGYYVARLEHAEKGDWIEIFNKKAERWEWSQWNR